MTVFDEVFTSLGVALEGFVASLVSIFESILEAISGVVLL